MALDTFDFWVGSVLLFVLALIQSLLYGWAFGIERGATEAHRGAHIRIPHFVQLMLKYVVPIYLIVVLVGFCYQNLPGYVDEISENSAALSSILFIGGVLAMLLLLVRSAGRRWEAEGRLTYDDD